MVAYLIYTILGGIIMQSISKETGYYLPLSYNDNKIALLVRDPYWLYAYWDISNEKRESFIKQFGEDSWNNSKPVLKVTNITEGQHFYIEINDFASSWYLNVNKPNCVFCAEIGRLFPNSTFVMLLTSNPVHTPQDSPSKDETAVFADYRDVKNVKEVKVKPVKLGRYDYETFDKRFNLSSASVGNVSSLSNISSESLLKR